MMKYKIEKNGNSVNFINDETKEKFDYIEFADKLYVNRLHTVFFNKFQPFSLSFFTIFCLSFTFWNRKRLRSLFFPRSLSLFFCFTPNHAPQGSPAWSSHSAPSLPFFSDRYTQWKAPTFPQSADESS